MPVIDFLVASHAHLSTGLVEALSLLAGERDDVRALALFVDGHADVEREVSDALASIPGDHDVVVCADILGGSVCNEFARAVAARPRTHLVANVNLPTLISLAFAADGRDVTELVRSVVSSPEVRPVYVNDLLAETDRSEDDF